MKSASIGAVSTLAGAAQGSSGEENDLRIQQELIQSFTSYVIDYNFVQCSFTNKLFKIFYKQVSLTPLDQIMG